VLQCEEGCVNAYSAVVGLECKVVPK
jgi:hypothetical protein